jgi:hypothetical protein
MRLRHGLTFSGALLLLGALSVESQAQVRWLELGCQRVGFQIDRDVIRVGVREGRFRAIRLKAIGNSVHMLDLKVIYANGAPDDIPVRALIPDGGQSGPLDLRGFERAIDRIEMIYRTQPNFRGQAVICAEGLAAVGAPAVPALTPAPPPPQPARWVLLGCRKVGFGIDRDVLRVGGQKGRFKAIRLKVAGNDVHMLDLKVVYGNGAPDDIPVRANIAAGTQTRPLDLQGRERFIDNIQMIYRSRPNFRGEATICVEGLD